MVTSSTFVDVEVNQYSTYKFLCYKLVEIGDSAIVIVTRCFQFGLGKMLEKLEDRTFPAFTFSNFVDYVVNQNSLGGVTVGTLITFDKFIRNPKWRMSFC